MASRTKSGYTYQLYDRPGLVWSIERQTRLIQELRDFAANSLHPLPDYQCLSLSPHSLDDKLILIARHSFPPHSIAAFVSTMHLSIPPEPEAQSADSLMVLHTGLTCISPELRREGLTIELFSRIFFYMVAKHPGGFWITSLAEVPSSLVSISHYATQVFPSLSTPKPSPTHIRIARTISEKYREQLFISPNAVFDRDTFLFKGSNPPGSCFRKDSEDERFHHRRGDVNEFYRKLLGRNEGNEVLQVGYITRERILEANQSEGRLRRSVEAMKANL